MTKLALAAALAATLGLAACAQEDATTPSRVGAQSSAPESQALGSPSPGGVGAGNTSSHPNGTGGGGGGTGGGTGNAQ